MKNTITINGFRISEKKYNRVMSTVDVSEDYTEQMLFNDYGEFPDHQKWLSYTPAQKIADYINDSLDEE